MPALYFTLAIPAIVAQNGETVIVSVLPNISWLHGDLSSLFPSIMTEHPDD